jgi:hypothetical protein
MRRTAVTALLIGLILASTADATPTIWSYRGDPYAHGALDRFAELEGLDEQVVRLSGGVLPIRKHLEEVEGASRTWFQVEGAKRECDVGWIAGLTLGEILIDLGARCNLFFEVRSPHQVFVHVPEDDAFRIGGTEVIHAAQAYPERAKELEVEGTVIFRVLVNRKGIVTATEMVREWPAGYGFATAAEPIVRSHGFEPRERDGEPVETTFTVYAEFTKAQLRRLQRETGRE